MNPGERLLAACAEGTTRLTFYRPHTANALVKALIAAVAGDGIRPLVLDGCGGHLCRLRIQRRLSA